jgi:uncharacterized membrane protein
MPRNHHGRVAEESLCCICRRKFPLASLHPLDMLSEPVRALLDSESSEALDGYICPEDLSRLRLRYVHELLQKEQGELQESTQVVLASLEREGELISRDAYEDFDTKLSFGQRLADKVAEFGGSWAFIITFGVILTLWISVNTIGLLQKPFDPFPYILLNLLLSSVAAMQAPVIMMSQNRKEARDRLRSENDYKVNLKAELEIRSLHTKLDMLISHQWQRLLEIQEIQTQMLEEMAAAGKPQQQ